VISVVTCSTGIQRYGADLPDRIVAAGGQFSTVECFDRCEACERSLLARIDGAMMRLGSADELLATLDALRTEAGGAP
jgi:hypothetical protein